MPRATRGRRGAAIKHLDIIAKLRGPLRATVDPERMLRAVAELLAEELGQYVVVDVVDRRGAVRRLDIQHADASRRARLRVACDDATFPPGGRVARLLERGGTELLARVSDNARHTKLADLVLLQGDAVKSYMASAVVVNGTPMAVLSLAATYGTRRYDARELDLLAQIADWTGLGVENALRREAQPRASTPPPPPEEIPVVRARISRRA